MKTSDLLEKGFSSFGTFDECFSRLERDAKDLEYLLYSFVVDEEVKYIGYTVCNLWCAMDRIRRKHQSQTTNKNLGDRISETGQKIVEIYFKKIPREHNLNSKESEKYLDDEKKNVKGNEKLPWSKR